jgi:hypothetical protein
MEFENDLDLYGDEVEVQLNQLIFIVQKQEDRIRFLEHQLDVLTDKLQGWWYN